MVKPQFQHDCNICAFLGRYKDPQSEKDCDLYYCGANHKPPFGGDVIARYSSDGADYTSSDLLLLIRGGINELAYGLTALTSQGEEHLAPREGSPLHVAAAIMLNNNLRIRVFKK